MKKSIIKEFYRTIHLDDLTLAYSGNFTDSMTEKIIELSETYLDSNEKLSKLKKRTSFLVAECFQNVVRHSTKDRGSEQDSSLNESFFLRFYDNRCYIASENLIPNKNIETLRAQLDQVNKFNMDELKVLYRNILGDGTFSDKGGAGLGLVEMARKTGNRLTYSFDLKDDDHSLFYLMLVLENENTAIIDRSNDLEKIKQIIKNVQADNMFLLYKGDFEKDILDHIEQILERNLDTQQESLATKIKLVHAANMTMQKIGKFSHGMNNKSNGMLFFGRHKEWYMINATFPVDDANKECLENLLSEIKSLSKEELDMKYRNLLKLSSKENEPIAGLGFTQLAMISKACDYEFDHPEGLMSELVFQIYI